MGEAAAVVAEAVGASGEAAERAGGPERGIQCAIARFYKALNHALSGDPQPMRDLWPHEPDVTLLDPCGGLQRGWAAVGAHWEWLAAVSACGRVAVSDLCVTLAG